LTGDQPGSESGEPRPSAKRKEAGISVGADGQADKAENGYEDGGESGIRTHERDGLQPISNRPLSTTQPPRQVETNYCLGFRGGERRERSSASGKQTRFAVSPENAGPETTNAYGQRKIDQRSLN
jgi:hypothetical protein